MMGEHMKQIISLPATKDLVQQPLMHIHSPCKTAKAYGATMQSLNGFK
jgi:hypothetical protein